MPKFVEFILQKLLSREEAIFQIWSTSSSIPPLTLIYSLLTYKRQETHIQFLLHYIINCTIHLLSKNSSCIQIFQLVSWLWLTLAEKQFQLRNSNHIFTSNFMFVMSGVIQGDVGMYPPHPEPQENFIYSFQFSHSDLFFIV